MNCGHTAEEHALLIRHAVRRHMPFSEIELLYATVTGVTLNVVEGIPAEVPS